MPRTLTRGGAGTFEGVQRIFQVAQPAPATDWTFNLPGEGWWRLLSMRTTFTTSSTAGTRGMLGQYSLAGQPVATWGGAVLSTVSITVTITWTIAPSWQQNTISSPVFYMNFLSPDIMLQPGGSIGTSTLNIQTGDQYGTSVVLMEQYFSDEYEPQRKPTWASTIESLAHHPEFAHIG